MNIQSRQNVLLLWFIILLVAASLAACIAPATATPVPIPMTTGTARPTSTLIPTATVTPEPLDDYTSQIAFLSDRGGDGTMSDLYVINTDGSGLTRLVSGPVEGWTWSPNCEKGLFTSDGLYVVNADGSELRRLDDSSVREEVIQGVVQAFPSIAELPQKLGSEEGFPNDIVYSISPAWSPDGRQIAFTSGVGAAEMFVNIGVYIMNADDGELTRLAPDRSAAEAVLQIYIDEYGLKDNVERSREWIQEQFGIEEWLDVMPWVASYPVWSPDGRKIAFKFGWMDMLEIYVINADGSGLTRLGSGLMEGSGVNWPAENDLAWSPDSEKIAFIASEDFTAGGPNIYVVNADGSELTRLTNGQAHYKSLAWSPTEQQIIFVSWPDPIGLTNKSEIYVMNADGSGLTSLTNNPNWYASPVWSPDGRQIAFASGRDGNEEIYVMDADGSNLHNLTQHPARDHHPVWLPACAPVAALPPAARPASPPAPAPIPVLTRHLG